MSAECHRLSDRILGAKIVAVEETGLRMVRLAFEHRGTDDDAGYIDVPLAQVHFDDEDSPPAHFTERKRAEAAEAALAEAREALRWIANDAGPQGCGLVECEEIARAALTGEAT